MTEELVDLRVAIPAHVLAALAEVAAGVGMHPAQWLAAQARAATLSKFDSDELVQHWSRGLADGEIGRRMNKPNNWVAQRRRSKGLPANRKYPRTEQRRAS